MIISKTPKKAVRSINDLFVDLDFNVRDKSNLDRSYDLTSMKSDILATGGKITQPIVVWVRKVKDKDGKETTLRQVLNGNRRTLAGQMLSKDPATSQDVVKNLERVDVMEYEGISEEEANDLVLDQGGIKELDRHEIALTIWRLIKNGVTVEEIVRKCFRLLASYTGNKENLAKALQIKDLDARAAFCKGWFHGTLDNVLRKVNTFGPVSREQFLLTQKGKQALLTDDEKTRWVVAVYPKTITELSKAVTKDKAEAAKAKKDAPNPPESGEEFRKVWAEALSAGTGKKARTNGEGGEKTNFKELVDSYQHPVLKGMLAWAAGSKPDGFDFAGADDQLFKQDLKMQIIGHAIDADQIADPKVRDLLVKIMHGEPAELETVLKTFAPTPA